MIRTAFHAAQNGSDETKQEATRRLLVLLALHEAAEQLTMHTAFAHAGGGEIGIGDDRMAEEQQTVQLIERLQGFEYGTYEYDMQFALMEEAVIHHAAAEELSEVPLFEDLTEPQRLSIGRAFDAVARVADDGYPIDYDRFSTMMQAATAWLAHATDEP